ncbi:hypothetical protein PENSTE_c006G00948 [Penicillium steckii]|uniref:Nephrocystin 3-like N-terminal domain-containing protein n=1 Tax=Penicillium steckii TaxID=303698 RepID=A0A1V6THZ7_9EURO|nr:hypothetical protein PENSTE_c006G00948 [Penicillium steckii]
MSSSNNLNNTGSGISNANTSSGTQNNDNSRIDCHGPVYFGYKNEHSNPLSKQDVIDNDILQSLAFPQIMTRREDILACHGDTCQWILASEPYLSWKRQTCELLWIKGKPGAGKSTLMAFLYENHKKQPDKNPGIRLDFFFTSSGTELQGSPTGMFRSMLNQIFAADSSIRPQICEAYDDRCKHFGTYEQQLEWPRKLLKELLADAIIASASNQPLTLFVDALDEAEAHSAQELTEYFCGLAKRAATKAERIIRICISCRHYPKITHRGIEIIVENHNHGDINTFIREKIWSNPTVQSDSEPEAWDDLTHDLIQQADGIFQWAHIVMPMIKQKIEDGNSPRNLRDWLSIVSNLSLNKMENVYRDILFQVIQREDPRQSLLLFQWLCLAERSLTLTEMRFAMAAKNAERTRSQLDWPNLKGFVDNDNRMEQRVNALSGGLAETVSKGIGGKTIGLIHQSVKDFLLREGLAFLSNLAGGIDSEKLISQCQRVLYRSCLMCLDKGELSHNSLREAGDSYEVSLVKAFPLLRYAVINLFVHAEKAGESRIGVFVDEIAILKQQISRWARIYQQIEGHTKACPAEGTTLLHMASAANMVDVIDVMCSENIVVDRKNAEGQTAMHLAAAKGHTAAAETLRRNGANILAECKQRKTPLIEAANHGHVNFVECLLRWRVDIDGSNGPWGTALQSAVSKGQIDVVRYLIEAKADVNAKGGEYGNALHAAIWCGSIEMVHILLNARAELNKKEDQHINALHAALSDGNSEIIHILANAGALVNFEHHEHGNALNAAAFKGDAEIVNILLRAGADVNAKGGRYGNALQAAADQQKKDIVEILLRAGADVNAKGGLYGSALQAAASDWSIKIVQLLLNHGANVNAEGGRFGNALQAAAHDGSAQVLEILLEAGAQVNAKGGKYGNALQAAANHGNAMSVKMLLEHGADANARGGYFGNALRAAASGEVAQILRTYGATIE